MQQRWRPVQRRASTSLHGASMAYEMLQNPLFLQCKSVGGLYRDGPPRASMEPPWQKGKEKAPRDQKGNGKTATSTILDPIPLGNQTARTHARTKRNDFPVEHPQPPILLRRMRHDCNPHKRSNWIWASHCLSRPFAGPPASSKLGNRLASCYPISGRGK
jgi:hypothetical protein